MIPNAHRPLALASVILLALSACAASPPATAAVAPAIDLGPSTRIASTRVAMAGASREMQRMATSGAPTGTLQLVHDGAGDAHATGTVNAVDPAQHKINLSHTAIPSLGWPAMTMEFAVARSVDLSRVKPGARVNFSIQKGKDGMFEVQSVQPAGAGQ
jgi:Cu/Ag efflux protein CusF